MTPWFTISYCSYLSMQAVKKPFSGIMKLFFENWTFKKTFFFFTKSLTAWFLLLIIKYIYFYVILLLFFTIFYCSYLSMHEVKKPFAGIKKLSIWHGKPFFLLQNLFFWKSNLLKNLFFHKVELTAWIWIIGHLAAGCHTCNMLKANYMSLNISLAEARAEAVLLRTQMHQKGCTCKWSKYQQISDRLCKVLAWIQ